MSENKKLGLVLAGGGALGAYQVGAIEALEELGYKFDVVTGTSIGAINGALVCAQQVSRLRGLWEDITPEKVMVNGINLSIRELGATPKKTFAKDLAGWGFKYLKGGKLGADISPFKKYVKEHMDIDACLGSPIQYGIVTTYFPSMKVADIDMHKVSREEFLPFIHASSACFPIFPIEKLGPYRYVDGFYNDNLPIRLAINLGADDIIALDMKLFSLKPQHSFYLTLPNVTYIAPYVNLGSMMDFSQEVIQRNMKIGYNDVMKHYKKYRGYSYTFSDYPNVENYLSFILKEYDTDSKYLISEITNGIKTKMDEIDYFIRTAELIALKLQINCYERVFTFEEFKKEISHRIVDMSFRSNLNQLTSKEKKNRISDKNSKTSEKVLANYLTSFAKKYLEVDLVNLKLEELPSIHTDDDQ